MPKLTGYKEVAVIEIAGKDYYFAIYDDGQNYSVGDTVIVSGAARTDIREIKENVQYKAIKHIIKHNTPATFPKPSLSVLNKRPWKIKLITTIILFTKFTLGPEKLPILTPIIWKAQTKLNQALLAPLTWEHHPNPGIISKKRKLILYKPKFIERKLLNE